MFEVSYDFYANVYGGTMAQSDFPPYQRRANIVLDRMTYGHIQEEDGEYGQWICGSFEAFTEDEITSLSYAVCGLVDTLETLDDYRAQQLAGASAEGNVKSRTSGGESISYGTTKTQYDEALTDDNAKWKLYKDAVFDLCDPFAFRYNPFYAGLESRW